MVKRYAELVCNGLEVRIKSRTITKLKSAVLLQIMKQVAEKNQFITEEHPKMAFCLYFSLDDAKKVNVLAAYILYDSTIIS